MGFRSLSSFTPVRILSKISIRSEKIFKVEMKALSLKSISQSVVFVEELALARGLTLGAVTGAHIEEVLFQ